MKFKLGDTQWFKANAKYNAHYQNHIYAVAIAGKSLKYANALISEAMAICGSPYHKLSNRNWSQAALAFLNLFVPAPPGKERG